MKKKQQQAARGEALLRRVAEQRDEGYQVMAEAYCDSPRCPVREVELHIKDYDNELVALTAKRGWWSCPVCSEPLKLHWAMGPKQYSEQERERARWSVNEQMRTRDLHQRDPDALVVMDARDICDDRLPPTPEGWFGQGPQQPAKTRTFVSAKQKTGEKQ